MAPKGKWSSTGNDYPVEEKLAEVEREIVRRKATLPGQVRSGAVAEDVATKRLDIMRAIARDYRNVLARAVHAPPPAPRGPK